jgi:hypothetical protein
MFSRLFKRKERDEKTSANHARNGCLKVVSDDVIISIFSLLTPKDSKSILLLNKYFRKLMCSGVAAHYVLLNACVTGNVNECVGFWNVINKSGFNNKRLGDILDYLSYMLQQQFEKKNYEKYDSLWGPIDCELTKREVSKDEKNYKAIIVRATWISLVTKAVKRYMPNSMAGLVGYLNRKVYKHAAADSIYKIFFTMIYKELNCDQFIENFTLLINSELAHAKEYARKFLDFIFFEDIKNNTRVQILKNTLQELNGDNLKWFVRNLVKVDSFLQKISFSDYIEMLKVLKDKPFQYVVALLDKKSVLEKYVVSYAESFVAYMKYLWDINPNYVKPILSYCEPSKISASMLKYLIILDRRRWDREQLLGEYSKDTSFLSKCIKPLFQRIFADFDMLCLVLQTDPEILSDCVVLNKESLKEILYKVALDIQFCDEISRNLTVYFSFTRMLIDNYPELAGQFCDITPPRTNKKSLSKVISVFLEQIENVPIPFYRRIVIDMLSYFNFKNLIDDVQSTLENILKDKNVRDKMIKNKFFQCSYDLKSLLFDIYKPMKNTKLIAIFLGSLQKNEMTTQLEIIHRDEYVGFLSFLNDCLKTNYALAEIVYKKLYSFYDSYVNKTINNCKLNVCRFSNDNVRLCISEDKSTIFYVEELNDWVTHIPENHDGLNIENYFYYSSDQDNFETNKLYEFIKNTFSSEKSMIISFCNTRLPSRSDVLCKQILDANGIVITRCLPQKQKFIDHLNNLICQKVFSKPKDFCKLNSKLFKLFRFNFEHPKVKFDNENLENSELQELSKPAKLNP